MALPAPHLTWRNRDEEGLVFVAALGLLVALPASAARPDSQKAKIVRLTKENKALRHRVHDLTLARDSARMGSQPNARRTQRSLLR